MSELMSRWSKKHLSQLLNLVTGMLLVIILINEYTKINIQCDWLKIVSVDSNVIESNVLTWLLSIVLLNGVIFDVVRYFLRKTFDSINEDKYYDLLVNLFTIENIIELIAAVYAMIFVLIQINADIFNVSCLSIFTYVVIGIRFFDAIWHHFYYGNLEIINKTRALKKKD